MKNKFLWILSAAHMITDTSQGALPAILPFLIVSGGLSYAQAAGLTFALAFSSSLVQPLFGIWSDKKSMNWLILFGVLSAGGCLSLIGPLHKHYWVMFVVAIFSGLGLAAFHPEAARVANYLAGKKKAGGMSIFSVGGNAGFAIGPILVTPAMLYFGLSGSLILAIPAVTMFIIVLSQFTKIQEHASITLKKETPVASSAPAKNEWGKFSWLTIAVIARSVVFHNVNTFMPLYWVNVLGQSKAAAASILTIMFVTGAFCTLLGGHFADRIGINNMVKIGWVILIPSLYFFTRITNPIAATLCVIFISFSLFTTTTPMIVLGQKYLPGRLGLASGITMGLGVSIGGIVAPLVGRYADAHGLVDALQLLIIAAFVGSFVALTLKKPRTELMESAPAKEN